MGNQPGFPFAHDEHHLKTASPKDPGGDAPITDMRYDDDPALSGLDCLLYMKVAFVRIIQGTAERKSDFVAVALRLIVELPPDAVQMKQAATVVKNRSIKRKTGTHPMGSKKEIACRNDPGHKPDDPYAEIAPEPVQEPVCQYFDLIPHGRDIIINEFICPADNCLIGNYFIDLNNHFE
jgi:hypothetical protein